jgi:hypothetical protein
MIRSDFNDRLVHRDWIIDPDVAVSGPSTLIAA